MSFQFQCSLRAATLLLGAQASALHDEFIRLISQLSSWNDPEAEIHFFKVPHQAPMAGGFETNGCPTLQDAGSCQSTFSPYHAAGESKAFSAAALWLVVFEQVHETYMLVMCAADAVTPPT